MSVRYYTIKALYKYTYLSFTIKWTTRRTDPQVDRPIRGCFAAGRGAGKERKKGKGERRKLEEKGWVDVCRLAKIAAGARVFIWYRVMQPLLKKAPVEKPPVEEKMEMTRAAPVQQSAPPPPSSPMKEQPTMTATPPPHTDDENGWIIPLDQLSQDELDQPEVQISRL